MPFRTTGEIRSKEPGLYPHAGPALGLDRNEGVSLCSGYRLLNTTTTEVNSMQQIGTMKSERCHSTSPLGREAVADPSTKEVAELGSIASGALYSNRIMPCEPAPDTSDVVAGETTIIIHEEEGGEPLQSVTAYLRSSGIVHRAMRVLEQWEYRTARISSSLTPVDIIAFRKSDALLVQVMYSKVPVPDAKTLENRYHGKMENLRLMGTSRQFRKIVMAYSPGCGWKYYEVLPGGLMPAWDLPEIPE
jgi:hypothetical protein